MKYQIILAPQTAFEQVKAHTAYLKNNGGEFVYDSGYKLLTGDESAGDKDTTLALTALAMLICTLNMFIASSIRRGRLCFCTPLRKGEKLSSCESLS